MQRSDSTQKHSFFSDPHSAALRIWHWLTFLFIAGSMITVLFAATIFSRPEGPPPAPKTSTGQVVAAKPQPFDFSKLDPATRASFQLEHKVWDAHRLIGFGVAFLLLSRIVIEITTGKDQRLLGRIRAAVSSGVKDPEAMKEKKHYVLVKRGYLVFYVLLAVMATSGMIMAFDHAAIFKTIIRPVREIHSVGQYLIYTYVLAHLLGVIRADIGKHRGMVSSMIHGAA